MPVILNKSTENRWIDVSISTDEAISLIYPAPSEILKAHTISPLINDRSANRNTPEVIKPYNYSKENLLF